MVQNAKEFNDPKSEIYEDAERIRKHVFNFMKLHNPAYKEDPKYTAFPTPIARSAAISVQNGTHDEEGESDAPEPRQASEKPKQAARSRRSEQADRKSSIAPSATTGEVDVDGEEDGEGEGEQGSADAIDFTGKTFQEAQQMIISYLLHYTDDE